METHRGGPHVVERTTLAVASVWFFRIQDHLAQTDQLEERSSEFHCASTIKGTGVSGGAEGEGVMAQIVELVLVGWSGATTVYLGACAAIHAIANEGIAVAYFLLTIASACICACLLKRYLRA